MFKRKPKTRMEQAREDFVKIRKQADDARKDVVKQLNASAKHLRSDVENLLDDGDGRASQLAKELEHVAHDIEHRTEKQLGVVSESATNNIWMTVAIAFGIGLLIGLLLKVINR